MKRIGMVIGLIAALGGAALAEGKAAPQMTTEQRAKMAAAHEKMAACLRTDRPLSECHGEMMKTCQETMGSGNCPMMGGMKHHGHTTQPASEK